MTDIFDNDPGSGTRHSVLAREAAQWLVVLSEADCTREEREEFISWLRRSNLHVEEFLRISELTGSLARYRFWPDDSVTDLIARARAGDVGAVVRIGRASGGAAESARFTPRGRWRAYLVVAVCLGVVSVAVGALEFGTLDFGAMAGMFGWDSKTYATSVGEIRSITLEDGSVVELNTRSRVRARFTRSERRVQLLSGEAIFKVAKNPGRPFRVTAGSTEIVAVGTQFNVDAHDSSTVVTVLEGRVRVSNRLDSSARAAGRADPQADQQGDQPMELARGEQAIIARHRLPVRVATADTIRATAWTERRLFFDGATLTHVAAEFARYNDRVIRIHGDVLAARRISGVFNATDQESFIEFLRAHSDVRVREDARGWILEPGSSEKGPQENGRIEGGGAADDAAAGAVR